MAVFFEKTIQKIALNGLRQLSNWLKNKTNISYRTIGF
jgi:hypothetical protein